MNVILVCTGNTCRSPLAEALARKMAAARGIGNVTFSSAGTGTIDGAPATDAAILVGLERGVDLSRHRARPFSADLVHTDTLVLTLSESHVTSVLAAAPKATVYMLDEYGTYGERRRSVIDPFGGELDDYREAANDIEVMLNRALDRLVSERTSGHR